MEVATFYTMFNLDPVGKYFIQFCGTTPCMLRGAEDIKEVARTSGSATSGHVSADGNFSWLEVECLGACCNAPMVQINDDYYEDLTVDNFNKLLDDLAAGRPVKKGSQIGRIASEPFEPSNPDGPGPLRRLAGRRMAQALRGGGPESAPIPARRPPCERAGAGQGREADGGPRYREPRSRHAREAGQERRDSRSTPPTARKPRTLRGPRW